MSKFLVGTQDGKIRGTHEAPLDFSISGRYVINVPPGLAVRAQTDVVTDLVNAKLDAIRAEHPTFTGTVYDELLGTPNVDPAQSTLYAVGPNKRTKIFPGGSVVTNQIPFAGPIARVYVNWYGFILYSDPGPSSPTPEPPRLLYNYNPLTSSFEEFDPTVFSVTIRDSTNSSTLLSVAANSEQNFSFGPGSIRLRFTNSSPDTTFHLSDWVLLYA